MMFRKYPLATPTLASLAVILSLAFSLSFISHSKADTTDDNNDTADTTTTPNDPATVHDDGTTLKYFAKPFGPAKIELASAGASRLTRTAIRQDAGVDWMLPQQKHLPLNAQHDTIRINPRGPVDGGYLVVSLVVFDKNNYFLGEIRCVEDTQTTDLITIPSVSKLAQQNGFDATRFYHIRLRINPVDLLNAAFEFDDIIVGPNVKKAH